MKKSLLTITEAAREYSLPQSGLRRLVREGSLPVIMVGTELGSRSMKHEHTACRLYTPAHPGAIIEPIFEKFLIEGSQTKVLHVTALRIFP